MSNEEEIEELKKRVAALESKNKPQRCNHCAGSGVVAWEGTCYYCAGTGVCSYCNGLGDSCKYCGRSTPSSTDYYFEY